MTSFATRAMVTALRRQCSVLKRPIIPAIVASHSVQQSDQLLRLIHSTQTRNFPVRRRRRGGGITPTTTPEAKSETDTDEDSKDDKQGFKRTEYGPVTDPEKFAKAASTLMDKLFHALKPLERFNQEFILTRGIDDEEYAGGEFILIDLGPVNGQYTIQVDLEQSLLILQSPISGQLVYILSKATNEWCGAEDGHAFEGMLVRDLIRQCNGVPNL